MTLTRGARHLAILDGGWALVFLRGDIQHKNLWRIDLEAGGSRPSSLLTLIFGPSTSPQTVERSSSNESRSTRM
jgi:hypothetical protein